MILAVLFETRSMSCALYRLKPVYHHRTYPYGPSDCNGFALLQVPHVMADVSIPPEENVDDVYCTIVDSSGELPSNDFEMERSHVYDCRIVSASLRDTVAT